MPGRETRRTGAPGRESLPFFPYFLCLGRNLQPRALGISTFFPVFRHLGRDLQPAAPGISTFSADFRCLGRNLQPRALGISTFFPIFAVWVEIYYRRHLDSLPFSRFFSLLGRDFLAMTPTKARGSPWEPLDTPYTQKNLVGAPWYTLHAKKSRWEHLDIPHTKNLRPHSVNGGPI